MAPKVRPVQSVTRHAWFLLELRNRDIPGRMGVPTVFSTVEFWVFTYLGLSIEQTALPTHRLQSHHSLCLRYVLLLGIDVLCERIKA